MVRVFLVGFEEWEWGKEENQIIDNSIEQKQWDAEIMEKKRTSGRSRLPAISNSTTFDFPECNALVALEVSSRGLAAVAAVYGGLDREVLKESQPVGCTVMIVDTLTSSGSSDLCPGRSSIGGGIPMSLNFMKGGVVVILDGLVATLGH